MLNVELVALVSGGIRGRREPDMLLTLFGILAMAVGGYHSYICFTRMDDYGERDNAMLISLGLIMVIMGLITGF